MTVSPSLISCTKVSADLTSAASMLTPKTIFYWAEASHIAFWATSLMTSTKTVAHVWSIVTYFSGCSRVRTPSRIPVGRAFP